MTRPGEKAGPTAKQCDGHRSGARDSPVEVILEHGDGGVGDAALVGGERRVHVGAEVTAQLLDDDGTVGDLLAVELDERQLALVRAELHPVVDVLRERERARRARDGR